MVYEDPSWRVACQEGFFRARTELIDSLKHPVALAFFSSELLPLRSIEGSYEGPFQGIVDRRSPSGVSGGDLVLLSASLNEANRHWVFPNFTLAGFDASNDWEDHTQHGQDQEAQYANSDKEQDPAKNA